MGQRLMSVWVIVMLMGPIGASNTQAPITVDNSLYCNSAPDSYLTADFKPACAAHDWCYSRPNIASRRTCDRRFLVTLMSTCWRDFGSANPHRYGCLATTRIYDVGVRSAGRPSYEGLGDPA